MERWKITTTCAIAKRFSCEVCARVKLEKKYDHKSFTGEKAMTSKCVSKLMIYSRHSRRMKNNLKPKLFLVSHTKNLFLIQSIWEMSQESLAWKMPKNTHMKILMFQRMLEMKKFRDLDGEMSWHWHRTIWMYYGWKNWWPWHKSKTVCTHVLLQDYNPDHLLNIHSTRI